MTSEVKACRKLVQIAKGVPVLSGSRLCIPSLKAAEDRERLHETDHLRRRARLSQPRPKAIMSRARRSRCVMTRPCGALSYTFSAQPG